MPSGGGMGRKPGTGSNFAALAKFVPVPPLAFRQLALAPSLEMGGEKRPTPARPPQNLAVWRTTWEPAAIELSADDSSNMVSAASATACHQREEVWHVRFCVGRF